MIHSYALFDSRNGLIKYGAQTGCKHSAETRERMRRAARLREANKRLTCESIAS